MNENNELIPLIKSRIKNLSKQKSLSFYELGNLSDITPTCIRNWYSKRDYMPDLLSLIKICNALEIPLSQLVMNENEKMIPLDNETQDLINFWQTLTREQKDAVLIHIKSYKK